VTLGLATPYKYQNQLNLSLRVTGRSITSKIVQILNTQTNFHEPSHERYTPQANSDCFLHSVTAMEWALKF
jgi:hypothetical protein